MTQAISDDTGNRGHEKWTDWGAALGRIAMLDKPARVGKQLCPNSTDAHRIATMSGHEKSLLRKRARLESESHTQDEHVTEADMVRRLMSNLRLPTTIEMPTVTNEALRRAGSKRLQTSRPVIPIQSWELFDTGLMKSVQHYQRVSSVVRHVKGSERGLSQRINCYASNAGTGCDSLRGRRADRQCHTRGSESVVVGGVTTTQGGRENRSQGEGTQTRPVSRNSEANGSRPCQRQR